MDERGMEPYIFNLKIIFYARYYPEDVWDIGAEVTYPEQKFPSPSVTTHTFPSVTVKYDRAGDTNPDEVAERMVRDIVAFVSNPRAWEENYVTRSSDLGQKIQHLQEDLEETEKYIDEYRGTLEQYQRQYARLLQQRAELQAQLDEK